MKIIAIRLIKEMQMRYLLLLNLLMLAAAALAGPATPAPNPTERRILVRVAALGDQAGRVDIVSAANGSLRESLKLNCDRLHYGGGVLACLRAADGQSLKLDLADRKGNVQNTIILPRVLPASRVRVSHDGAMAAVTGFTAGSSYYGTDFTTKTYLLDVAQKQLTDVLRYRVIDSEQLRLKTKRINVWGVSFDPKSSNRFVATVGADGDVFLAQGDVQAKTLTLLRADMECPSFSPDGTRVAFKRRIPTGGWWPAVYEFSSGSEWVMREVRSIDDQIEWLDNQTIAYELDPPAASPGKAHGAPDIMVRKADGSGTSSVLVRNAGSPSAFD